MGLVFLIWLIKLFVSIISSLSYNPQLLYTSPVKNKNKVISITLSVNYLFSN